jgi:predicted RNA-binding protein with PUA-like domain
MNVGDKAFFYHSNCKEPGIVGTMEIVKEYSEDRMSPIHFSPFVKFPLGYAQYALFY